MFAIISFLLIFLGFSWTFPFLEDCLILDMSREFSNDTKYWGMNAQFKMDDDFAGVTLGKFDYKAFKFSGPEHGGTHLDAPIHFSSTGMKNHQVPLSNLIGEACVVDVSSKVKSNPDYEMTVPDLIEWETKNGRLRDTSIVIMRTGWEAKYGDARELFGTATVNDANTYHFPGLSPEAAAWLVKGNKVKSFGTDSPSVDFGPSKDFKAHQIFSAKNICNFENLMNLNKLPARGATIIALPMKIKEGSGGPVRVIAIGWTSSNDPCVRSSAANYIISILLLSVVMLCCTFLSLYYSKNGLK